MRKLLTGLLIFLTTALAGCGYNDFQRLDEQVTADWAGVLAQYQRRADLVPNIVADRAIAHKLPQARWSAICDALGARFRAAEAGAGVLLAIEHISAELAAHFPPQARNDNELPDAPVVL